MKRLGYILLASLVLLVSAPALLATEAGSLFVTKLCGYDEAYCQYIDSNNRALVLLKGGTDNTSIGNVGDRLKADCSFSSATTTVPSWSKKLRYDDMNVANGGVARSTSIPNSANWTTVYSYSGSGYIGGMLLNLDTFATGWEIKMIVDGSTIFQLLDTDLSGDTIYDVDDVTDVNQAFVGVSKGSHDRFVWHAPMSSPVYYGTSVVIQVRRQAATKKFQAGLIVLSKES